MNQLNLEELNKLSNQQLHNDAYKLFEDKLNKLRAEIKVGDYSSAPFPLLGEEARIYLMSEINTLQWVLEMLPQPIITKVQQLDPLRGY